MWLERERTRRTIVTLYVEAQDALRAAERPEGPGRLPNERQRSWAQRIFVCTKEGAREPKSDSGRVRGTNSGEGGGAGGDRKDLS